MKLMRAANGLAMLCLATVISIGSSALATDIKIGYVDMKKAIQETSTGKKAKKELEAEFKTKSEQFKKKEADINKMKEDLEKKAAALSDEARNKKAQELQTEMLKFQREVSEVQQAMALKERNLTNPILEKIQEIIDQIAKKDNYTVIVEKNDQIVLWAKKDIDLTDMVVKEYEKSVK